MNATNININIKINIINDYKWYFLSILCCFPVSQYNMLQALFFQEFRLMFWSSINQQHENGHKFYNQQVYVCAMHLKWFCDLNLNIWQSQKTDFSWFTSPFFIEYQEIIIFSLIIVINTRILFTWRNWTLKKYILSKPEKKKEKRQNRKKDKIQNENLWFPLQNINNKFNIFSHCSA